MNTIEIDGSFGEGGGQMLRTSLSLAAITGQAVHFTKIRANRKKPGLMRQHRLCAVATAEICGGTITGAEINSQEMNFTPGRIKGGEYCFDIGSAGCTTLVAQTILPVLLFADEPSRVVLKGGTYVSKAPSFDFFDRVFLPCLRSMGADVTANLVRPGFYPVGGGEVVLEIKPIGKWRPLELVEGGDVVGGRITALGCRLKQEILEDEVRITSEKMGDGEWLTEIREVEALGSGNVLFLELERQNITELFSVCGEYDLSRKAVACRVAQMARKYISSKAVVGVFLADQLLLYMALGQGGKYLTLPPSLHTETNAEIIRRFLNVEIEMENLKNGTYMIEVKK